MIEACSRAEAGTASDRHFIYIFSRRRRPVVPRSPTSGEAGVVGPRTWTSKGLSMLRYAGVQLFLKPLPAKAAPQARLLVLPRDSVVCVRPASAHYRAQRGKVIADLRATAIDRDSEQQLAARASVSSSRFPVIHYDRWVADPATELDRTCSILEVDPFVPECRARRVSTSPDIVPPREDVRRRLLDRYAANVTGLVNSHPQSDLDLWPDFWEMAHR
jgi:hypothetical protein